jgi:hypothetical protein
VTVKLLPWTPAAHRAERGHARRATSHQPDADTVMAVDVCGPRPQHPPKTPLPAKARPTRIGPHGKNFAVERPHRVAGHASVRSPRRPG